MWTGTGRDSGGRGQREGQVSQLRTELDCECTEFSKSPSTDTQCSTSRSLSLGKGMRVFPNFLMKKKPQKMLLDILGHLWPEPRASGVCVGMWVGGQGREQVTQKGNSGGCFQRLASMLSHPMQGPPSQNSLWLEVRALLWPHCWKEARLVARDWVSWVTGSGSVSPAGWKPSHCDGCEWVMRPNKDRDSQHPKYLPFERQGAPALRLSVCL